MPRDTRSDRRRLLTAALAGLGAAALTAPGGARAFSLEAPTAAQRRLYREACAGRHGDYHAELVREVLALLEREEAGSRDPERVEAVLAAVSCPLCGCSLDKAES